MKSIKSASVFGLGKLGACIAATLAQRGFEVVGVDIDPDKVRKINAGLPPVEEPLLAETIAAGRARLRATQDVREAVPTDVSFFIPPSPSLPDGSFSTEFLLRAMQPMAKAVREAGKRQHLFVCSSTTTPGAMDQVLIPMLEKETGWSCGTDFGVCYNPEFIALGNVVNGLLEPDLVLIGESDPASGGRLEALYKSYNRNQPRIARMSIISAELAKISVNSYITMKISFTNQLRLIAERFPQANIHDVLDAIGSDSRINQKYLRAGLSYGSLTLPGKWDWKRRWPRPPTASTNSPSRSCCNRSAAWHRAETWLRCWAWPTSRTPTLWKNRRGFIWPKTSSATAIECWSMIAPQRPATVRASINLRWSKAWRRSRSAKRSGWR